MHYRELAEIAALVAVHASTFAQERAQFPHQAIEEYWMASKCRLERWLRLLRQLAAADRPVATGPLAWARVRPVLEEILVSELLTRLWTASSAACDAARGDQDLEPIARNIFCGHLEARRRLLLLLADCRAIGHEQTAAIDRLRRRVERWGDMLLAHVADLAPTAELSFEPGRARDFAEDFDRSRADQNRRITSQLVQASLRASLAQGLADRTPNADLNRRIGAAILSCFREDQIEPRELAKALWLERINRTAIGAEEMVDSLLRLEATG